MEILAEYEKNCRCVNIYPSLQRPQNLRPLERPQISSNNPNFVGCGISLILDDGALFGSGSKCQDDFP